MDVREISIDEFTNFATEYSYSSVLQTKEYADVMRNQEYTTLFLGAYTNDDLVGASLILIKRIGSYKYAYAPRGFLINYNDKDLINSFTRELKRYLSKYDVTAIKIAPPIIMRIMNSNGEEIGINPNANMQIENLKAAGYHHYGFNTLFEAYKPRFEAMIDLSIGEEELFNNIKKEYKTKIRSAEKKGIKIYKANANEIDVIYEQTKSKYPRDLKYFQDSYKYFSENNKMEYYYAKLDTNLYLNYVKKAYESVEKNLDKLNEILLNNKSSNKLVSKKMIADKELEKLKQELIEANKYARENPKGIVLASMLIAKNITEVYLYMDGFDVKYKTLNAKHILMWKIMEKYSKLGYKRLNLGGVTDIRQDNPKYKGLNEFKTNFNASVVEYAGDFELVINQAKYFLYRQILGK